MSRTLLGMLTPSSNTVLEPATAAQLAELPEASAHFGRFAVTEIAFSQQALAQFAPDEILRAARLLAHARCQEIAWNGTSAGWLGFDRDEALCAAITQETGAVACTSVLAINELFGRLGVRRFGLVTPYVADVQQAIAAAPHWPRRLKPSWAFPSSTASRQWCGSHSAWPASTPAASPAGAGCSRTPEP